MIKIVVQEKPSKLSKSELKFIFEAKWSPGSTAGPGLTGSVTGLCKCSVGAMYKRIF